MEYPASQMKVSICIPAYKNPDGIRRLLESVMIQDYRDFDVTITDDSPDDEIKAIASEFTEKGLNNLTYIHNEVRKGPSENWNEAVRRSGGEYVKIMHHDDYFTDEHSLGEFVKLLDENDNAVLGFSGSRQVKLSNPADFYERAISDADLARLSEDWRNLYFGQVIGAPSATIYRRTVEEYNGDLTWIMDMEFLMRLFKRSVEEGHTWPSFACSREPLVSIGMSDTQLTEAVRDNADINIFEYGYIMNEFGLSEFPKYRSELARVAAEYDQPYKKIEKYGVLKGEYDEAVSSKKADDRAFYKDMVSGGIKKFNPAFIGKTCFYIGLLIEITVVILEKSAIHNDFESWMFRIAFIFFAIKCLTTKYKPKELVCYAILCVVAAISYFVNTKDEIVRIAVFVIAMKDMDLKRVMKLTFLLESAGIALLALLSVFGVLGTVYDIGDIVGLKEGSTRFALGLGSANTLAIMLWALMILGIYVYHEKMKWWHYAALFVFSLVVYWATYTRTTFVIMVLTLVMCVLMWKVKKLQSSPVLYGLGGLALILEVAFSAWAAKVSNWHDYMTPFQNRIDDILTGRVESIYAFENGGGVLANWLPFSNSDFCEYFDMGYVRMFFWYGIIPSALMLIVVLLMIYESYKRRDYMGFVMILMFGVLTVVEAHIVSVYIARNYLLILAGAYLPSLINRLPSKGSPLE